MIAIWLIWTFLNGNLHNVDAFTSEIECRSAHRQALETLEFVKKARPDLVYVISTCTPLQIPEPPKP